MDPFSLRFNCLEMAKGSMPKNIEDYSNEDLKTYNQVLFENAAKYYAFVNGNFDQIPELKTFKLTSSKDVTFIDKKIEENLNEMKEKLLFKTRGRIDENIKYDDLYQQFKTYREDGKTYVYGTFMFTNIPTLNNRIYPNFEMVNAVEKLNIKNNNILGEIDHPDKDVHLINLDRVSHKIIDIWQQQIVYTDVEKIKAGNWMVKIQLLSTPSGKLIETLIDSGIIFRLSPRGFGIVDKNGYVKDYELVTIDILSK